MNSFKIAVAQVASIKGDVAINTDTHITAMNKADDNGISVLVFLELSLTGYEPQLARSLAFTIGDSRLNPLIHAAMDTEVHVVAGAPLITGKLLQIGAFIITPAGGVFWYSRIHFTPGEQKYFSPGQSLQFLDVAGEKIGIAICADTNVPEHAKSCADKGAGIYVVGCGFY